MAAAVCITIFGNSPLRPWAPLQPRLEKRVHHRQSVAHHVGERDRDQRLVGVAAQPVFDQHGLHGGVLDHILEIDEVMPSDEIDIIPLSAVCEVLCSLEELPRKAEQCHGRHNVFWKNTHVYVSAEEQVVVGLILNDIARTHFRVF